MKAEINEHPYLYENNNKLALRIGEKTTTVCNDYTIVGGE